MMTSLRTSTSTLRWLQFAYLLVQCYLLGQHSVNSFQTANNNNNYLQVQAASRIQSRSNILPPIFSASAAIEDAPPKRSAFQRRMLQQVQHNTKSRSQSRSSSSSSAHGNSRKSKLIKEVTTLNEFKTVVVDGAEGALVVVWFYAPWCRACRGTAPGFFALAKNHPEMKFVQVPAMPENTNLHQGLSVPSVPFVHVYHPTAGLVEERRLTRKYLPGFHKRLQNYHQNSCSLEQQRSGEWSSESPYEPAPKAKDHEKPTGLLP